MLTGLEIYKLLPKTNCKKCGFPTCLAFAMSLAAKKVLLTQCPDISEHTKQILLQATEPPIRTINVGKYKIGGETVLFRHEKTFYNPSLLGVLLKDTFSKEEIINRLKKFKELSFERVGNKYRTEMICVVSVKEDLIILEHIFNSINEIVKDNTDNNEIVVSFLSHDIDIVENFIKRYKLNLIGSANTNNYKSFVTIANNYKVGLIVEGKDLDEISCLTTQITGLGFRDLVIKVSSDKETKILEDLTQIRRLALKKNFSPFGYPTILICDDNDTTSNLSKSIIGILKYASIVVINSADTELHFPLITLRLNIYTDPQKPVSIEPKLYKIGGEPGSDAPLMVTTNFSLTYYSVEPEIINSKIPSWLLVIDADGLSVLTAWAAEKFNAEKIVDWIKKESVEQKVKHKTLIIPGYVAIINSKLNNLLPDWKIVIGPKEASGIPKFLKSMWKK